MTLRLNVGAGRFRVDGWVSIDAVPDFEPDYVEDATTLPSFQPGTVQSIYSGHLLEHVLDPMGALLRWYDLLVPGGDLTVTVPDLSKASELWRNAQRFPVLTDNPLTGLLAVATGFYSYADYHRQTTENPAQAEAQCHRRGFDLPILLAVMEAAGFDDLKQITEYEHEAAPKFAEPVSWQICVRGYKPPEKED